MLQSLSNENSENILSMRKMIIDTLEGILKDDVTIDELSKSKFGVDLQKFANICCRTGLLKEMGSEIKIIIDKLKNRIINQFFGCQEKAPDIIKDDDEMKICINEISRKSNIKIEPINKKTGEVIKTQSTELIEFPKEQAVMLIVCKEISELLVKVLLVPI